MLLADLNITLNPSTVLLLIVAVLGLVNVTYAALKGAIYNRGVIRKIENPISFYLSAVISAAVAGVAVWLIFGGLK